MMRALPFMATLLMLPACGCTGPGTSSDTSRTHLSLICTNETVVYSRPDSASSIFGTLLPGDTISVSARTSYGWLGFDPGVAQAGNVGIFRCRWVPPDGGFELLGDPGALSPSWAPRAGVAYAMAFEDTPVHSEMDSLSAVTDTLPAGSAAAITRRAGGWYRLNLREGTTGRSTVGWVRREDLSVSEDPVPEEHP